MIDAVKLVRLANALADMDGDARQDLLEMLGVNADATSKTELPKTPRRRRRKPARQPAKGTIARNCLDTLRSYGGPIDASELASLMGLPERTVHSTVASLVTRGFATSRDVDDSPRRKYVAL